MTFFLILVIINIIGVALIRRLVPNERTLERFWLSLASAIIGLPIILFVLMISVPFNIYMINGCLLKEPFDKTFKDYASDVIGSEAGMNTAILSVIFGVMFTCMMTSGIIGG